MNRLSIKIINHLFKYLNLKEIINCSLIFSNFKEAFNKLIDKEILCLYFEDQSLIYRYHSNLIDLKIDELNLIKIKNLNILNYEISKLYFNEIRKLIILKNNQHNLIDLKENYLINLDYLNYYKQLEYIEIKNLNLIIDQSDLNLEKLKFLILDCSIKIKNVINLNSPLEYVHIGYYTDNDHSTIISKLNFLFPLKLKYLKYENPQCLEVIKFKNIFINLECLIHLDCIYSKDKFLIQISNNLPNLKFLFLREDNEIQYSNTIEYFNYHVTKFNKNLIVYNCEFNMNDRLINLDYEFIYNQLNFRLPLICNLNEIDNNLLTSLSNQILKPNLSKYFNFISIVINKQLDNEKLISFFKSIKYLDNLSIDYNYDQNFFNQLSNHLTLDRLIFKNGSILKIIDFNFLSKLRLINLEFTNKFYLSYDLLYHFSRNKYSSNLEFRYLLDDESNNNSVDESNNNSDSESKDDYIIRFKGEHNFESCNFDNSTQEWNIIKFNSLIDLFNYVKEKIDL